MLYRGNPGWIRVVEVLSQLENKQQIMPNYVETKQLDMYS